MGTYINPGNRGFDEINTSDYVDKTGLIELINQKVSREGKLVCVSRPRRFGKSYAAKMLTAYYDCSCDSHALFDNRKIASAPDYEKHINKYNVIYMEMTSFISDANVAGIPLRQLPSLIEKALVSDLDEMYPFLKGNSFRDKLISLVDKKCEKQFIFIIDEWDAPIREAKNDPEAQKMYLEFLRAWFKNGVFTPKVVAAAYMTGILPIKTDGSQSALSDFDEFTMIHPEEYSEYIGFTEREVEGLCSSRNVDFKTMKAWYNGYSFPSVGAVYNPNSVMKAIRNKSFRSYWTQTSAAEALLEYISKSYNGLTRTVAELVGGIDVKINTVGFANDLTTFRGKDDVLTLLVHLGYLAYDEENGTVRIPNEEIKREFQTAIHHVELEESRKRLDECEKLFADTAAMKGKAVAAAIEKVHMEETAPLHYNSEDSLRSVIKLAYYTYRDHYLEFEELPAGKGYADVVYIPLQDSGWPALVVELKCNENAESAIRQILDKEYPSALKNFKGDILLVGVSYDRKTKVHSCRIVKQHR